MDFRKTKEQEQLLAGLSKLLDQVAPPEYIAEKDENHQPLTEVSQALYDHGYTKLWLPVQNGASAAAAADVLTLVLLNEEIGRHGLPGLLSHLPMIRLICEFGSEEQKKAVLELAARGQSCVALGVSEPPAGSDVSAIRATAKPQPDGTVIFNGVKTFQTCARHSEYTLLVTRDLENPRPYRAMSMWLVPMNLPGISIQPIRKMVNWHNEMDEVYWDNVRAPANCLVGKENQGFAQLLANYDLDLLLAASIALGNAEAAYEDACHYANQRTQFGQRIGKFQMVEEKIARMAVMIMNMKNLVYYTAWKIDQKLPVETESAMAKLYCAQSAFSICDDALQIFGGIGITMDNRIQRLWRNVRAARIAGSTDEIMVGIIARNQLKRYNRAR